jgi:D-3-phosphoglycerate dehydrogenase / 2-oxoglutarate reductase
MTNSTTRILVAEGCSLSALQQFAIDETKAGRNTQVFLGRSGEIDGGTAIHYEPNLKPEGIHDLCADGRFSGLIVRPKEVPSGTDVKFIVRLGTGTNNLDAQKKNSDMLVMNTPAQNASATAEWTFIAILEQVTGLNLAEIHRGVKSGELSSEDLSTCTWNELKGKTVAVAGMGDIGTEVARKLKAFGANVIGIGHNSFTQQDAKDMGILYATIKLMCFRFTLQ